MNGSTLAGAGALALALACAATLVFLPLRSLEAPALPVAAEPDPASMNAFASRAPFDPAHNPASATGSLPGAPSQTTTTQPALAGILSIGGVRKAMLSGTPGRWLAEGERADDWTVLQVQPNAIVVSRGAERATLTFGDALKLRGR